MGIYNDNERVAVMILLKIVLINSYYAITLSQGHLISHNIEKISHCSQDVHNQWEETNEKKNNMV